MQQIQQQLEYSLSQPQPRFFHNKIPPKQTYINPTNNYGPGSLSIIDSLLHKLGYEQTRLHLQQALSKTNPQESPVKNNHQLRMKQKHNEQQIMEAVNKASCFESMLSTLAQMCQHYQPSHQHYCKEQNNKRTVDTQQILRMQGIVEQKESQEQIIQNRSIAQHNQFQYQQDSLQVLVQRMLPVNQSATIPIYRTMEIGLNNKQAIHLDCSAAGAVCILDKDHELHVVSSQGQLKKIRMDVKETILQVRWVRETLLMLVNSQAKCIFYDHQLKLIKTIPLDTHSHAISVHTTIQPCSYQQSIKSPQPFIHQHTNQPLEQLTNNPFESTQQRRMMVRVIVCMKSGRIVASTLLSDSHTSIVQTSSTAFATKHSFKQITWLHNQSQQHNCQINSSSNVYIGEMGRGRVDYFGLTDCAYSIVKFDHQVQMQGIFWQTSTKSRIQSMRSSTCHCFLHLLLAHRQQHTMEEQEKLVRVGSKYTINYQYIKLDRQGRTLLRTDLHLNSNINSPLSQCSRIPYRYSTHSQYQPQSHYQSKGDYQCPLLPTHYYYERQFQQVFWLNPDWLGCFIYNNALVYFSCHSGNCIYRQQLGQEHAKVRWVGHNNTLLLQQDSELIMMRTVQQSKRRVVLSCRGLQQQSAMSRLNRLQGIPQNLLILLRSMRDNDLSLLQQI